jgi:hypothetical protein
LLPLLLVLGCLLLGLPFELPHVSLGCQEGVSREGLEEGPHSSAKQGNCCRENNHGKE